MKTHTPFRASITLVALATAVLSSALAGPLWAQTQDQSDDIQPYPPDALWAPADHHALVDLEGLELPILTLSNPSSDRPLELQVTATGGDGHRRSLTIELEAGGSLTVSLESSPSFGELAVVGRGRFTGELADARSDVVRPLPVAVHGAEPATGERSADKGGTLVCGGNWTLTCIYPPNCTYISPPFPGEVYESGGAHYVYWSQQYAIGDWLTTNSEQCDVRWKEDFMKPGCPKTARNCLNQLYRVSGTVSYP